MGIFILQVFGIGVPITVIIFYACFYLVLFIGKCADNEYESNKKNRK